MEMHSTSPADLHRYTTRCTLLRPPGPQKFKFRKIGENYVAKQVRFSHWLSKPFKSYRPYRSLLRNPTKGYLV